MLRSLFFLGLVAMTVTARCFAETAAGADEVVLENQCLRVVVSPVGARIVSLTDKRSGRELVKTLAKANNGGMNEVRYGQALNLNEFNDRFALTLQALPDGGQKLTATARSRPSEEIPGDVTVVKQYVLAKDSSALAFSVELTNQGKGEVGLIPWVRNLMLRGHAELPEDAHMTEYGAFMTGQMQPAQRAVRITDGQHYLPAGNWSSSLLYPGEDKSVAVVSVLRPQDMLKIYNWRRKTEDFATHEIIASPMFAPPGQSDRWDYHMLICAPVRNMVYASPDLVLGVTPHPTWLTADVRELVLSVNATRRLTQVSVKARIVEVGQPSATVGEQTLTLGDLGTDAITAVKIPVTLQDKKAYQLRLSFLRDGKPYAPGAAAEDQGEVVIPLIVGKHEASPLVFQQEAKRETRLRQYRTRTHRAPQVFSSPAFDAYSFPTAQRCFQIDRMESSGSGEVQLFASAGEYESAQIVLMPRGDAAKVFTVAAGELAGPGGAKVTCESVNRFLYVTTRMPSQYNALLPLGDYPEALLPVREITLQPRQTHPLFVTYHIPRGAAPGVYRGKITLAADGAVHTIAVTMTVWNNELPIASRNVEMAVSLKGDTVPLARNPDGTPWSREQQLTAITDMHLKYRMTPCDTGMSVLLLKGEFAQFEPVMQKFIDGGATKIFLGPIDHVLKNYAEKLPEVEAYLQKKGWFDYFYVRAGYDEASPDLAPKIRETCERWKKVSRIPIMETYYNDERADELFGLLDIWSRNFPLPEWTAARRAAGDHFWKVNAGPNWLEHEPWIFARRRYVMHWDHHITGSYIWCLKYWQGPKKWGEDWWADGGVGNLSACIMWPHETGILSTIRLEAMRDGLEDAILLWTLRERVESLRDAAPADAQQIKALEDARKFCQGPLATRINSAEDAEMLHREAGGLMSALNTSFPVKR